MISYGNTVPNIVIHVLVINWLMAVSRYSYPVLLLHLLGRLSSGSDVSAKSVCINDSVQLFSSIQINHSDTTVTLYKNSDKQRPIAWWTSINHTIKQENVVMDEHRNIWIINAHLLDEGNYIIKYDIRNGNALKFEVKLSIIVAPTTSCQPTVRRVDNILKASLESGDCGIPKVSVYWLEYIGVIYEGKDLAQLPPGREAGIYYACIEGPALSCIRSSHLSSDYCFPYRIKESRRQEEGNRDERTQLQRAQANDPMN
ncbi:hypothetical protein CHS0354_040417 [Potamilus streckersoni]|uniref:Uncharacterized protein n=1 Tax=Potamilus streckersoni TaxID=2493646 RepID=A0AAE0T100_9BIVA|nr:hypothetical protein CHS0354_040417 [Potamilus streckersoni]